MFYRKIHIIEKVTLTQFKEESIIIVNYNEYHISTSCIFFLISPLNFSKSLFDWTEFLGGLLKTLSIKRVCSSYSAQALQISLCAFSCNLSVKLSFTWNFFSINSVALRQDSSSLFINLPILITF